jgi:hypothetical protein
MGNELMTGFVDQGVNPLSRITVASLEDIGYTVDYTNVDRYNASDINPSCLCKRRRTLVDMNHGETHQLGLRMPGAQRRKLSDELYNVAVAYGKDKLVEKQNQQNSFGSLFDRYNNSTSTAKSPSVKFATNDVIAVFVIENGTIFDVVVRSER